MKKSLTILTTITVLILFHKCTYHNSSNNFESRIHTTQHETDWYTRLGHTDLEKHINNFNSINWEKDFIDQFNNDNFNYPDLELFDRDSLFYMSVTVCPDSLNQFQFCIGAGVHNEVWQEDSLIVKRECVIYKTGTSDSKLPIKMIELFYNRNYYEYTEQLNKMTILFSCEDFYNNLPDSPSIQ
ncbi:hypothetical protein [Marinifilum fragile]|uniref:hypothetical protein n=1 Tax=Marinifilum fragile TaxID=570161 RepID=UPI002AABF955|nr:hypothetical protein [Marinifilum fragile]